MINLLFSKLKSLKYKMLKISHRFCTDDHKFVIYDSFLNEIQNLRSQIKDPQDVDVMCHPTGFNNVLCYYCYIYLLFILLFFNFLTEVTSRSTIVGYFTVVLEVSLETPLLKLKNLPNFTHGDFMGV